MTPTRALEWSAEVLFAARPDGRGARAAVAAGLALLFALGALHWVLFFGPGELKRAHDWREEFQFHSVLKQALEQGVVPYHVSREFHGTDRFLASPQTLVSPQVLLLRWLDVATFVVANVLLLYAAGFAGCLLLRARYGLSLFAFAAVFLLFGFNGHLTAHLGVGHTPWAGYFLLPFFALGALGLAEGRTSTRDAVLQALALGVMFHQGSYHVVTWCLMLLVAVLAVHRRGADARYALTVAGVALALCLWRVLPAAVAFGRKEHAFATGYATLSDLLAALVEVRPPTHPPVGGLRGALGWWEYDAFVSTLGLAFLLYFGLYARRAGRAAGAAPVRFGALDGPMALLALASLGSFYAPIAMLPVPLLNGERVASRFLIVPLVLLATIAAIEAQRFLDARRGRAGWVHVGLALGLAQVGMELMAHSRAWFAWRIDAGAAVDPAAELTLRIVTREDPVYVAALQGSAAASAVAFVAVLGYLLATRRPGRGSGPDGGGGADGGEGGATEGPRREEEPRLAADGPGSRPDVPRP